MFSGLPHLDAPADAARLQAAAFCLDHGMAPRALMTALDLDPSVLDVVKFDPAQPRVPGGKRKESRSPSLRAKRGNQGADAQVRGVVRFALGCLDFASQ